ncbi:hypothetical protein HHK36_007263 [Tetracentron sinense]|uniref:RING-type domain-containing protein n=1 Tax=Tetracentron sinense TaxID=13715 RepID=A0A834ZM69_TETSI|nr:hypothetical protein HHK36_007263 [Tetracentron sinense]
MGTHEPYWRTNTSFSPPLSRGWDHRFHSDGLPYGSHNAVQLYDSSTSSNSKESRSWMRGDHLSNHQHSPSDGAWSHFSSPSNSFQTQQGTPPPRQGVNIDDYMLETTREYVSVPSAFTPSMEGTSAIPYSRGSSSHSDASEYESMVKTHVSSHRNFSGRCSFMSKAIHPLSFPTQTHEREVFGTTTAGNSFNQSTTNENSNTLHSDPKSSGIVTELQSISGFPEFGATTQGETLRWSSASSSIDFTDTTEQLDSGVGPSYNLLEGFKCGLCKRFLTRSSPWSSRRIVRSGDMPVAGVLSCRHVFHAECLEQTTPKTHKHDPPCPQCAKSEGNVLEHVSFSRLRNDLPTLRPFCEDGLSRSRGGRQVGDCVEGTLHAPPRNTMLSLNRSRLKKHLSLKGNLSKELPDKLKRSG